ncbi:unnamed protein product [Blepharisma stoltei]|uniref:RZ-type domain-containing protein n=1 Tax=Blepharisma stoltei TaxID=1481888 RepID=A0AAU9JA79_9CILI|nr:unnamed protein product [Blepharisma stoltei]
MCPAGKKSKKGKPIDKNQPSPIEETKRESDLGRQSLLDSEMSQKDIESQGYILDTKTGKFKECKFAYILYAFDDHQFSQNEFMLMIHQFSYKIREVPFHYQNYDYAEFGLNRNIKLYRVAYIPVKHDKTDSFQLKLWRSQSDDFYEKEGTFRDFKSWSHAFIFSMQIVKKTWWGFGWKSPDGEPVLDPIEQLTFYSLYAFRSAKWEILLPILIEQFNYKFDYRKFNVEKQRAIEFLQVLDYFIREQDSNYSEESSYIILALLGCLKAEAIQHQECRLDSGISLLLRIENFENFFEKIRMQSLYKNAISGIGYALALNKKAGGREWAFILNKIEDRGQKSIILHQFIEIVSSLGLTLNKDECEALQLIIQTLGSSEIYSKILACAESLLLFTELLHVLFLSVDENARREFNIKQNWKRAINLFLEKQPLRIDIVADLLEILHNKEPEFKNLFYDSNFSNIVDSAIRKCLESFNKSDLVYFKKIYKLYYNERVRFSMKSDSVCETLLKNYYLKPHELIENFNIDCRWLFKYWLKQLKINCYSDIEKIIKELEIEIKIIKSLEIKGVFETINAIINNGIVHIYESSKRILNSIFELAPIIDGFETLKTGYIQFIQETQFSLYNYSRSYDDQVGKILELQKRYKHCDLLKELLALKLAISGVAELPEKETKMCLYKDPSSQFFWAALIESHKYYYSRNLEYFANLISFWEKEGLKIVNEEIKVDDLMIIKYQSEEDRAAFLKYLNAPFDIKGNKARPDFFGKIKELLTRIDFISEEMSHVKAFIDIICINLLDVEGAYKISLHSFSYMDLKDFQYHPIILQIKELAVSLATVLHSHSYIHYFLQKELEVSPLSLSNIATICTEAKNKMKNELNSLFTTFENYPMEKFLAIFKDLNYIQKEISIIENLFPNPDPVKLLNLGQCLGYLKEKESLIFSCNAIKELSVLFTGDENIIKICQDCIAILQNIKSQKLSVFLSVSTLAKESLSKDLKIGDEEIFFKTINEISRSEELIAFLNSINESDMLQLKESVNDYDDLYADTQAIMDLENLWESIREIKNIFYDYPSFCKIFNQRRIDKKYDKIIAQLQNCRSQLAGIKELHVNINCKEEAKKKQIVEIITDSEFRIVLVGDFYDVNLKYLKNQKHDFNLPSLLEFKERASLLLHTLDAAQIQDPDMILLPGFKNLVTSIQEILANLNNLRVYGYPLIEIPELFRVHNGDISSVLDYEKQLSEQFKTWEISLSDKYSSNYLLTFLHGQQFWWLEGYLIDDKKEFEKEANSLLEYMGKSYAKITDVRIANKNNAAERLLLLGETLEQLPNLQNNDAKLNYCPRNRNKFIINNGEVVYLETSKILLGIFSVYFNSCSSMPRADQIFFCQYKTSWNELFAFLYRCFTNPGHELYLLVNCEELALEIQNKFKSLFADLCFHKVGDMQFKLGIITADKSSALSSYFKNTELTRVIILNDSKLLSDDDLKEIVLETNRNYVTVVTSEMAGLGKTTEIRQQVKQIKNYSLNDEDAEKRLDEIIKMFPIAGEVDCIDLCKNFPFISESMALHLHLSYVSNSYLLNEFLINLCIFRTLNYTKNIIIIPREIRIFIEVSNTYSNILLNSLECLHYFNHIHIEKFSLDRLIISRNRNDKLQFICSYLDLYHRKLLDSQSISEMTDQGLSVYDNEKVRFLLATYLLPKQGDEKSNISYIQLDIMIKILTSLCRNFGNCGFFEPWMINEMKSDFAASGLGAFVSDLDSLRSRIFESILLTVKEFTSKCIADVRNQQLRTSQNIQANTSIIEDEELADRFKCCLKWESSNHFTMVFLEDGSLIPIYRDPNEVPVNIKKLIFTQHNALTAYKGGGIPANQINQIIKSGAYTIEDYRQMFHSDFLFKLQTYCKDKRDLQLMYVDSQYVITPDNFLKMNLIYLRAISNIPIIIMGETGCGKTSLIQFFVENILGDQLVKISIHAGTTSSEIKQELESPMLQSQMYIEEAAIWGIKVKKLWVFFDEFNTTESVGLICEIICNRTLEGRKLPENMVFIGACNPYRLSIRSQSYQENVGIKKDTKTISKLSHVVKPLPETMIEYIWDYGALTANDEREYVIAMFKNIESSYTDLFVDFICLSHNHFQKSEDASSVSLRDVSRFIKLYKWFKNSIIEKKAHRNERYQENLKKYNLITEDRNSDPDFDAGILAFCHCYYLRHSTQIKRFEFLEEICRIINRDTIFVERIIAIIENEQNDYLARMELPKGTAFNKALRENIFTIIPCIINKIPVFLCGKPGCSKTLSIQLIFAHLRGKKSTDSYFQTLPELIQVPFQGSDSCTSEGIIKAFKRAEKYYETDKALLLPVIIFDEIGLAEISKHNPLKVLHNLLEIENVTVGFVGISNWRLDASKMNRALYLARPDPDELDLVYTANSIYSSFGGIDKVHKKVIKHLALSYFEFKNQYKDTNYADFYGLRDFYHLIKQASKQLVVNNFLDPQQIAGVVKRAIERNFGGKEGAAGEMGSIFMKLHGFENIYPYCEPNINILDLIKENLKDPSSRYLMLIGRVDAVSFILDKHLHSLLERRIIVGSKLKDDISQEEYGFRSLSDIILYMEKGISIILKNMDHIYSSLYDLFNQNFAVSGEGEGERKYCRIALGALFNPRCYVNNNFHAIVFMDNDKDILLKADAPFLNRFEKHNLSLDKILTSEQKRIQENLIKWAKRIFYFQGGNKMLYTINHLFPIYSSETIALLVLFNYCADEEETMKRCKDVLLRVAPSDIKVLLEVNYMEEHEKIPIISEWNELHFDNFPDHIDSILNDSKVNGKFSKLIAFTYDTNYYSNEYEQENKSKMLVKELSSFKSEQDLTKDLQKFYVEDKEIYILELEFSKESQHLSLIKFIIDKLEDELKIEKNICIIIHMKRNIKYDNAIILFESWKMQMFDGLSTESFDVSDKLAKDTKTLISENLVINFEDNVSVFIEKCLLKFKYDQKLANKENLNDHIASIINSASADKEFVKELKGKVFEEIKKSENVRDWKEQIFMSSAIVSDSNKLENAIKAALSYEIEKVLTLILYSLEESSALISFFKNGNKEINAIKRDIWLDSFWNISTGEIKLQDINQGNLLSLELVLNFPTSKAEYKIIEDLCENWKEKGIFYEESIIKSNIRELYKQKSLFYNKFDALNQNLELQELLLSDLVKILLNKNLINQEFEDFVFNLLRLVTIYESSLEEKILAFMKFKPIFVLICYAINLFYYSPESKINAIQSYLNKSLSILEKLKNKSPESEEDKEEESNCFSKISQPEWKLFISNILNELIIYSCPDQIDKIYSENWESYPSETGKLISIIKEIENIEVFDIRGLDYLEFWATFSTYMTKYETKENLLKVFEASKSFEKANSSFLYNQDFVEYVFGYMNQNSSSDIYQKAASLKFQSYYLGVLLKQDEKYVLKIAQLVEQSEIWRYSSELFSNLLNYMNIKCGLNTRMLDTEDLRNNKYSLEVEKTIEICGFESKFSILLNDFIGKHIDEVNEKEKSREHSNIFKFMERKFLFAQHYRNLCMVPSEFPYLNRLFSISFIKQNLEIYASYFNPENSNFEDINEESRQFLNKINEELSLETSFRDTLKLYCLKNIHKSKNFDGFIEENRELPWIQNYSPSENENERSIFPYFPSMKESYLEMVYLLKSLINDKSENILDEKIINADNPKSRIVIAMAFMNEVFIKHSLGEKINTSVKNWFTNKKDMILSNLGKEFYQLLYFFINNFHRSSYLCLYKNQPIEEVEKILILCSISILILSYRNFSNPLSSLFFTPEGTIDPDFQKHFNNLYVICSEPSPMLHYLKDTLKNFNSLISSTWRAPHSKGSTYKCSSDCDFLYFVNACGGPTEKGFCPYCKREIGGIGHKPVPREGHENLSHEEAMKFLQDSIARREANECKGCQNYGSFNGVKLIRELKPITSESLHLILSGSLYVILKLDVLRIGDIASAINKPPLECEGILWAAIQNDFTQISSLLSIHEPNIWIFSIISELPEIIEAFNVEPSTKEIRDNFENYFEREIINSHMSPSSVIIDYKNNFCESFGNGGISDILDELKGMYKPEYPNLRLFRLIDKPSAEEMKNYFLFHNPSQQFNLLSIYFKNYEEIKTIESLYPIIDLTNSLLEIYNHKIARDQARNLTIKDAIFANESIKEKFRKFKQAWKSKGIDELYYECKRLESIEFEDENSPLSYFLVDNKEVGGGMYMAAALLELASRHNKLLGLMKDALPSNQPNSFQSSSIEMHPVQNAMKNHILSCELDDPDIINSSSINNPQYGKGRELIYDFEKLQSYLANSLLTKKYLDKSKLGLIQYQFELLNIQDENSGLISEIHNLICQQPFSKETEIKVKLFFKELKEKEERGYQIIVKEIYSSLDYILCYLKNSKENPEKSISDFCQRLNQAKISEFIKGRHALAEISLFNIVALYEHIEFCYFPYMKDLIRAEFQKSANKDVIKHQLHGLIEECDGLRLPTRLQAQNALMRFIMRCLTAELNPNLPIQMYIQKSDFWDKSVSYEQIQLFEMRFSEKVKISHSLATYEEIMTIGEELEKRARLMEFENN